MHDSTEPQVSFTAVAISCSDPTDPFVVCMEECPSRILLARGPHRPRAELGACTAKVVGAEALYPDLFGGCSTTHPIAQSDSVERSRSKRPSSGVTDEVERIGIEDPPAVT